MTGARRAMIWRAIGDKAPVRKFLTGIILVGGLSRFLFWQS